MFKKCNRIYLNNILPATEDYKIKLYCLKSVKCNITCSNNILLTTGDLVWKKNYFVNKIKKVELYFYPWS